MKRNFPPRYAPAWGLIGAVILCIACWVAVLRWIFG